MALDSLLASLKSGVSEVSEVQPSNGAGLQRYPMKSAEVSEVSGKVSGGGPDTPDTPCNLQRYQRKPALGAGCTPDTPDTPEIIDGEGTAAEVGAADTADSLLASLKRDVSGVSDVQPSSGAACARYVTNKADVSGVSGKLSGGAADTADTSQIRLTYQRKPALGAGCTSDTADTAEIINGEGAAAKVGAADTVKSRCWWIHFADREPVECWSSPPASLAEILENRPDAIAAEPFEPGAAKSPPAHHGGEGAPTPDPDDRRYCTACRNLRGAVCSIARPEAGAMVVANRGYRPDLTRLVRCAGFIEVAP